MTIWDQLAAHAHHLIATSRRNELTPSITLMRSLHVQIPDSPAALCAHLDTASAVLPTLACYARAGDRHALLMCAVLMRHPLRRIAELADPDGYRSSDRAARDNDTVTIFFTLIRVAAEPEILTARYLYNATLRAVLAARPKAGDPAVAVRVDPRAAVLDRTDEGVDTSDARVADLLATARERRVITALEYTTLTAVYLDTEVFSVRATADVLCANVAAVERRCQRAIRKLTDYLDGAASAA